MQQGRQEFRQRHSIAGAGGEQTGRAINRQGKAVIGIPLDVRPQPEQFEVAKQQLVFAGVIAVRREHHLVGAVQHALGLRQVVAVSSVSGVGSSTVVRTCSSGRSA
jgi:hypothetical protein